MDTIAQMRTFLKDRHGIDLAAERLAPDTSLDELGIDSLMLLELMFEFEETCKARFPRATPTPHRVGELVALIEALQHTSAPA